MWSSRSHRSRTLTATGASACRDLTAPEAVIAADIVANPQNYYANVHTSDFPGWSDPRPVGYEHTAIR